MSAEVGTTQAKQPFLHKGARGQAPSSSRLRLGKKLGGIVLGRTRLGIGGIGELMSVISVRGVEASLASERWTAHGLPTMVAFVRFCDKLR